MAAPTVFPACQRQAAAVEPMGTWYLSLIISLVLIMVGLFIHWTVVLAGLVLPFVPMISMLIRRRRDRLMRQDDLSPDSSDSAP